MWIRDGKIRIRNGKKSNPGSGIKHPGSATLFESGKKGGKKYGGDQRRIP
jgi:hypothetical protein